MRMFCQQDPGLQFAVWTLSLSFLTNIIIPGDCFSSIMKLLLFLINSYMEAQRKAEKSLVSLVRMGAEIPRTRIYSSVGSCCILRQPETLWAPWCSTEHHLKTNLNGLKDAFQPQHYRVHCLSPWGCKHSSRCAPCFREEQGEDQGHCISQLVWGVGCK